MHFMYFNSMKLFFWCSHYWGLASGVYTLALKSFDKSLLSLVMPPLLLTFKLVQTHFRVSRSLLLLGKAMFWLFGDHSLFQGALSHRLVTVFIHPFYNGYCKWGNLLKIKHSEFNTNSSKARPGPHGFYVRPYMCVSFYVCVSIESSVLMLVSLLPFVLHESSYWASSSGKVQRKKSSEFFYLHNKPRVFVLYHKFDWLWNIK